MTKLVKYRGELVSEDYLRDLRAYERASRDDSAQAKARESSAKTRRRMRSMLVAAVLFTETILSSSSNQVIRVYVPLLSAVVVLVYAFVVGDHLLKRLLLACAIVGLAQLWLDAWMQHNNTLHLSAGRLTIGWPGHGTSPFVRRLIARSVRVSTRFNTLWQTLLLAHAAAQRIDAGALAPSLICGGVHSALWFLWQLRAVEEHWCWPQQYSATNSPQFMALACISSFVTAALAARVLESATESQTVRDTLPKAQLDRVYRRRYRRVAVAGFLLAFSLIIVHVIVVKLV